MLCLVTGSTGFIGSHLCRALVGRGHHVRAFHRAVSNTILLNDLAIEHAPGDILDADSLRRAMAGVELVFHAAARAAHWRDDGAAIIETTVSGTANVLNAARACGMRRVVFTSSLAACGLPRPGRWLTEADTFNTTPTRWPYGYAKHCAEELVRGAAADGLDCVIVNPASVFGAGDVNRIGGDLILEVARRPVPVVSRGGMNVVHIADVVAGHLAALERGRAGERYILGGENLSHAEILRMIAAELGRRAPRLEAPDGAVRSLARLANVLSPFVRLPLDGNALRLSALRFYCDTSKARRELGLPQPRPAREAIREAVAWYRENGHLDRSRT